MSVLLLGLAMLLGASTPGPAPVASASTLATPQSTADSHARPLPTPQFRRYSMADGLPSTGVYAVAQDRDGAMWFGTKGGIARFDGVHFQVFRHIENDPDSLYDNEISTLLIDSQSKIWAGGLDAGLNRYDPRTGKFEHWGHDASDPTSLASDRVWIVVQSSDGSVWVGTSAGLDRMREGQDGFEHIVNPLLGTHSIDLGIVAALYVDSHQQLWIGCEHGVFRRSTDGQLHRVLADDPKLSMDAWRIDGDGDEVRISTGRGLFVVGSDGIARRYAASVIPDINTMSSTRDHAGHLWVGTQRGMFLQLKPGDPVTAVVDQPLLYGDLPGSWIWQTFVDREGGLWVALLDGGVAYLAPSWDSFSRFTHVPDDLNSLRDSLPTGMARGRDGRHVWVGEREGRVDRLDPVSGNVEHVLSGLRGDVVGMTEDFQQRLWVAVQGALYRYDYVHDVLARVDPQQTFLKQPLEVEPGPDGKMYARTFGQGVLRIDPESLALTRMDMDQPNDKVLLGSEMALHNGVLWYGSDGGLMRLNQARDRFEMVAGVPVGDKVDAFDFADDGLWMANANGLTHYHFKDDGLVLDRTIDAKHGWPSVSVVDIHVDAKGCIWIFGHDGLWRFDPATNLFRVFGLQDGLANGEFERGFALMPSGYLFDATLGGVVTFDPDHRSKKTSLPSLSLTQASVHRRGVTRTLPIDNSPLQIGWKDSQLDIQTRVFSYIDPAANQYLFRLSGFDLDWVDTGNRGEREFTGLGRGDYVLDVMARGANGDWTHLATPLHIHVQAPPWLRWWAWLLYALVVLALAWLLMLAWRRRLTHRYRMEIAEQRRHIAEQASAAKSHFLATLSHEIRTPMTGVIGMAELLLSTPLNSTQREYAEAMQRSGGMLLKLLNDALDMARIEAGKLHLELAPFDPRALVFDVLRLQQSAAQLKGLSIAVDIGDDMPKALLGDALRIKQVLFNLTNNALKFTAHGSVTVRMTWHGDELRFDVIDTGPGIPESSRERLFRRFEQEDGPHRQAGSGLGLAICRELVSLMGGMLTLESEIGRGSTFIVQLPLAIADEVAPHAAVVPAEPVDHVLDVLLVEDNETVAATIRGMLEQQGHRVRCARNALNALTELTQGHCDVILLDLDLPGIDGYQVANLIRQGEVTKQHMPIIAVTARTGSDDELRSREAGMDGFLRKPLTGAQLSAALNEVFAKPSTTAAEADLA